MADDVRALKAEVRELRDLLRLFAFPANPTAFQSTDGGCTETILPDESVQRVRDYFSRQSPFKA